VISELLASSDSKAFTGSGVVKDGNASDLSGVQQLLSTVSSYPDEQFEQNVRSILAGGASGRDKKVAAAANRLLQLFEEKWKSGPVAVAAAPAGRRFGEKGKIVTREISEKDKRSLVERLTELVPRQLVEGSVFF
jgi:hypothetical protein